MSALNLQEIPRVSKITKEAFIKDYFKPQKPVVIEGFIEDWSAYSKWSLDYMKGIAGDKTVPLYDDRPVDYKDGFNEPHATMKMSEYVDRSEATKFGSAYRRSAIPVMALNFSTITSFG